MTATTESATESQTFEDLARHIDELRDRIDHLEPSTRQLMQDTIEAITEFNKQGLIALVHLLRGDERGGELLYEAVEQPEVMALFVSHGIIRTDRTIDVLRVVEQIRPYLVTSSIEMEVESVRGDVAFVRFATGCSAPDQVTKDEIMGVIMQRVPGLKGVEEVKPEAGTTFIGLDTLRIGPGPESA
jgi:Fe-S cluster biogenesis protein NfuA